MARTAAVFFDVDFTLIHPGPRFQATGYRACCERHGVRVDTSAFDAAVEGAASVLDSADQLYDPQLYVRYTQRIIELMGGDPAGAELAARELYDDWAANHHFELYEDVVETLEVLRDRGIRTGLISNSHRCLESFQTHFDLGDLVGAAVSSVDLRYMKPHPAIFQAALERLGVPAQESVMVGDSLRQDIEGARRAGMRGILLARGAVPVDTGDVTVIRSLRELTGRL